MRMMRADLVAQRHAGWGSAAGDGEITLLGVNYSAAAVQMQIRPAAGDTATPLIALANGVAGAEGIYVFYDAAYLHPVTGATVGASLLQPRIDQATMAALPYAPDDPAQPLVLAYDIRIAPVDAPPFILIGGQFTVYPGVTI